MCNFDLTLHPEQVFSRLVESSYSNGTDKLGTTGRTVGYASVYDPVTQICSGANHWELTTNNGESFIVPHRWYKHIPTLVQVYSWLRDAGFEIESTHHNYTESPIPESLDETTYRAAIWARKV